MDQRGVQGAAVGSRPYGRAQALGLQLPIMPTAVADLAGMQCLDQLID